LRDSIGPAWNVSREKGELINTSPYAVGKKRGREISSQLQGGGILREGPRDVGVEVGMVSGKRKRKGEVTSQTSFSLPKGVTPATQKGPCAPAWYRGGPKNLAKKRKTIVFEALQ